MTEPKSMTTDNNPQVLTAPECMAEAVEMLEINMIHNALVASQGNVRGAARLLRTPERTVWHKLRHYNFDLGGYRAGGAQR